MSSACSRPIRSHAVRRSIVPSVIVVLLAAALPASADDCVQFEIMLKQAQEGEAQARADDATTGQRLQAANQAMEKATKRLSDAERNYPIAKAALIAAWHPRRGAAAPALARVKAWQRAMRPPN